MISAVTRATLHLFAGLLLVANGEVSAASWQAAGMSFSDELGGFRLLSASGAGTPDDPVVLVEEITGIRPAILVIRSFRPPTDGGISTPSRRILTLSLVKIVINRSRVRWSGFDLELRQTRDRPSRYDDGLSFDQLEAIDSVIRSDRFDDALQINEPIDRIEFDHGVVAPHEQARLAFKILDVNPRPTFYLLQEPVVLLTEDTDATPPIMLAAQPIPSASASLP